MRLEKGFVREPEMAQKWGQVSQMTGGHQQGEGRPLGGRWGTEVTGGMAWKAAPGPKTLTGTRRQQRKGSGGLWLPE